MAPTLGTDSTELLIDPPGHNLKPSMVKARTIFRYRDGRSETVEEFVERRGRGDGPAYGRGKPMPACGGNEGNPEGWVATERGRIAKQKEGVGLAAHTAGEAIKIGVGLAAPVASMVHSASEGDIVGVGVGALPLIGKANKLNHIVGRSIHKLAPLVAKL